MKSRSKRPGCLVLAFLATCFGVVGAAGWFLDEPLLDDGDLFPPTPGTGENDPFRKFAMEPPREILRAYREILADRFFWYDFDSLPQDEEVIKRVLQAPPGVRAEMRDFAAEFEREIQAFGGDPRVLCGVAIEGWGGDFETVVEDLPPEAFPFADLFRVAARVELVQEDFDQAFRLLGIALRIESHQVLHHPSGDCTALWEIQSDLLRLIQRGAAQRVEERDSLLSIANWTPPQALRKALISHSYRYWRTEILEAERWSGLVPKGEPLYRVKRNRTVRRLAELIRQILAGEANAEIQASHPLVRAWLDPHGDRWLEIHSHYVRSSAKDYDSTRQVADMIRIAIASHWFEEDRDRLPTSLKELSPFLASPIEHPERFQIDTQSRRLRGLPESDSYMGFMLVYAPLGGGVLNLVDPDDLWKRHSIQLPPLRSATETEGDSSSNGEPRKGDRRSPQERNEEEQ